MEPSQLLVDLTTKYRTTCARARPPAAHAATRRALPLHHSASAAEAGVAAAPGTDFEDSEGGLGAQRLRLSYCGGQEDVKEGMVRLQKWWRENAPGAAS